MLFECEHLDIWWTHTGTSLKTARKSQVARIKLKFARSFEVTFLQGHPVAEIAEEG